MNPHPRPRPLVLCILDGWGERRDFRDNAVETAQTPNWHRLMARWPHARLQASEHYVGLPDGQMGNSEVGHTNLGAGRLVLQDLVRIDAAVASGELARMPALRDFIGAIEEERRHRASPRAVVAGRSAFASAPDRGTRPHPRRGRGAGRGPRHSRWPRHAARGCALLSQNLRERRRHGAKAADRDRRRPLLRDGSRPALGSG